MSEQEKLSQGELEEETDKTAAAEEGTTREVADEELEKELEEALADRKRERSRHREAGRGKDGSISEEDAKKWLRLAGLALGICFAVVGFLAYILAQQDKKVAALFEVDSAIEAQFSLNRKGKILQVVSGEVPAGMETAGLQEGIALLLAGLMEEGELEEDNAVLLTVRPFETGELAGMKRFAADMEVFAETALKAEQSRATVFVGVVEETPEVLEIAEKYEISIGKAAFVWNLIEKNTKLKLEDIKWLASLSIDELLQEINTERYNTSFAVITTKKVYEKKEKPSRKKETKAASEMEEGAEGDNTGEASENAGTGEASENETAGGTAGENGGETAAPGATKAAETAGETGGRETTESSTRETMTSGETSGENSARETEKPRETSSWENGNPSETAGAAGETAARESEKAPETTGESSSQETTKPQETVGETTPPETTKAPETTDSSKGPGYSSNSGGPGAPAPTEPPTKAPAETPAPTPTEAPAPVEEGPQETVPAHLVGPGF